MNVDLQSLACPRDRLVAMCVIDSPPPESEAVRASVAVRP